MAIYTFIKILSKLAKIILYLPPALTVFQPILLALSIIYTLLLSTIKQYINLCNRIILIKTRRTSFTSQISCIGRANLNLKINVIINLRTHLEFFPKHFFNIKDILYIVKKVVSIQITHNKSIMIERNVLKINFQNTKPSLVISVICKTIQ